jgi:hypothetical protein
MSKFDLTPPGRVVPISATQDLPVPVGLPSGVLQTLMPSIGEVDTFADAVAHDFATFQVLEDRTIPIAISVSAHDSANSRIATGIAFVSASRIGAGALTVAGLIALNYVPFAAPWNTIAAAIAAIANPTTGVVDTFSVQVTGLANISIRWSVYIYLFGGMVR